MSAFEIFRENKKKEHSEGDVEERYKKLSSYFAVMKWISLSFLVIFVIVSVSLHGDELSFDSIRYIVRYMKNEPVTLSNNGDGINFDYDSNNKSYSIGEDFAIIGKDNISVYDYSGNMLFSENLKFNDPKAVSNGNELILYDIGGKEVRFYNSYSMVHRISLESPIYGISVSETGNYLLMTASEGYRSGFRVYNKSKELLYKHNFGELTLQSSSLSKDGKSVVSASLSTINGAISSLLQLYDITQKNPLGEIEIEGEYPLHIEFWQSSIVLFTDKSVRFFDRELNKTNTYYYGDRSPSIFRISEEKLIITYKVSFLSQSTEVEFIGNNGEDKISLTVPYSISDIGFDEDKFHILSNSLIESFSNDGNSIRTAYLPQGFNSIMRVSENKFLIVRPDRAEIFTCSEN